MLIKISGDRFVDIDLTLSKVDLSNCGLIDSDFQIILTYLQGKTNIKSLNLYRNNLGDASAQLLATITVEEINLRYNNISAKGLDFLLTNQDLKVLDLGRNNIDKDIELIANTADQLFSLKLDKNPMCEDLIQKYSIVPNLQNNDHDGLQDTNKFTFLA